MTRRIRRRRPSVARATRAVRARLRLHLAAAAVALGAAAAPAVASPTDGTIAAVRDGNAVLFSADGAWEAPLTDDGTPDDPYLAPSQSSAGTIAVLRHDELTLLRGDGTL